MRLDGIKKLLTLLSQAIRNVDKLPENIMSKGAKRQLIDSIYRSVRAAQMGNEVWRRVHENVKQTKALLTTADSLAHGD